MKPMPKSSFNFFEPQALAPLFAAAKRVFDKTGVSFYLIGARDVWFLPEVSHRMTRDVDWVAAASDTRLFETIKQQLIDNEDFTATKNDYTLLSPTGITVDLLPFVDSLDGLQEVFERGTEWVTFDEQTAYQVATIPAIVLLKLLAYSDRPEHRLKDLFDIRAILTHYFDRFSEDIYEHHSDLFDEEATFSFEVLSAQVIGRNLKKIIGDSTALKKRVVNTILTQQIKELVQAFAKGSDWTEVFAQQILNALLEGLLE
jgi:predicted nucleotidyltransferase